MDNEPLKLVVVGRNGQIGWELMRRAGAVGVKATGLARADMDLTRAQDVARVITASDCAVVVNAAGYTAVDKAESERYAAFAANRDGPAYLAAACREKGVPLIHLSTDYVFDGTKRVAYTEDDPVNPTSVYGETKAAGERAVRDRLDRHVILRTAWVYGPVGHNFVKTMLRLGTQRDQIGIVDDQHGCPTAAAEIAHAVVNIAIQLADGKTDGFGTFHFCGAGQTTWCGFARAIFDLAGQRGAKVPGRVKPITTADYPTPASRPRNSVLDCNKIRRVFGIEPRPWRHSLTECIDELFAQAGGKVCA